MLASRLEPRGNVCGPPSGLAFLCLLLPPPPRSPSSFFASPGRRRSAASTCTSSPLQCYWPSQAPANLNAVRPLVWSMAGGVAGAGRRRRGLL
eukprot:5395476-Pyramimonas_sp.AAC.1